MSEQTCGHMKKASPQFTIVTSTFNAAALLSRTGESLAGQSFKDFEWIIVDGGSTDATLEVARGFSALISVLISEQDTGIYNAWNKALPHVTGQWVLFLGAGDSLFSGTVLLEASERLAGLSPKCSTAYGDVTVSTEDGSPEFIRTGQWSGIDGPWVAGRPCLPCHQGVFQRGEIFRRGFRFDERCRIAADNEVLLQELLAGRSQKIDLMVSRFHSDGISAQRLQRLRMVSESVFINWKLGIFHKRPIYQLSVLASNVVKHAFRYFGHRTI